MLGGIISELIQNLKLKSYKGLSESTFTIFVENTFKDEKFEVPIHLRNVDELNVTYE